MTHTQRANLLKLILILVWISLLFSILIMLMGGNLRDRLTLNRIYLHTNAALAANDPTGMDEATTLLGSIDIDTPEQQRALRAVGLAAQIFGRSSDNPVAYTDVSLDYWPRNETSVAEFLGWAERAENARDWETAAAWHYLATLLEPDDGDHWYRLAAAESNREMLAEAEDHYRIALAAPSQSEYGRSNIMVRLGELTRRSGRNEWQAIHSWFDRALGEDDFTVERDRFLARMGRAEAAANLNQPQLALDDYRWVAERQQQNYWAHVHSGRLSWFVDKDLPATESYLQQAIRIDDTSKWAYRELAQAYMQAGDFDRARVLFQTVLNIDPNDRVASDKLVELSNLDGE